MTRQLLASDPARCPELEAIGASLRAAYMRQRKQWHGIAEFAESAGVSEGTVLRVWRGHASGFQSYARVARELGLDLRLALGGVA